MIEKLAETDPETSVRIIARANFSLSPLGFLLVGLALSSIVLLLTGWMFLQGFWPVLLIGVMQLGITLAVLYHAWRKAWRIEVIEIGRDSISVLQRDAWHNTRTILPCAWTKVEWVPTSRRNEPPLLCLRNQGHRIEIGGFLIADEKRQFARQIDSALAPFSGWSTSNI